MTVDYICDANPNCGWKATDTSRPLSRGTKVGCPNCQGDARFIGSTSTNPTNLHREQAQEPEPERIRVCIRVGKEDWIGVAYAAETADPSAIHEYVAASALSSRDAEVKQVLEELRGSRTCWCEYGSIDLHSKRCIAASALYSKVRGSEVQEEKPENLT